MFDHGFDQLAVLTWKTESYELTYGGFDGLFDRLRPILFDANNQTLS